MRRVVKSFEFKVGHVDLGAFINDLPNDMSCSIRSCASIIDIEVWECDLEQVYAAIHKYYHENTYCERY